MTAATVEEAVQDTFVKVWNLAGRYDGSGEVAAWIWGIGIRTLLHRMRPRKSLLDRLSALRPTHASIDVTSAEDQVLLAVAARRCRWRARVAVTRAALGRPGHRARRPDVRGGGADVGHPDRNGEDTDDAGQAGTQGGIAVIGQEWHIDGDDLAAYAEGRTGAVMLASIEAHLIACERCRSTLSEQRPRRRHRRRPSLGGDRRPRRPRQPPVLAGRRVCSSCRSRARRWRS